MARVLFKAITHSNRHIKNLETPSVSVNHKIILFWRFVYGYHVRTTIKFILKLECSKDKTYDLPNIMTNRLHSDASHTLKRKIIDLLSNKCKKA